MLMQWWTPATQRPVNNTIKSKGPKPYTLGVVSHTLWVRRSSPLSSEFLVGCLEHDFYFPIHLGISIIPIDEGIFFREVGSTTNEISS